MNKSVEDMQREWAARWKRTLVMLKKKGDRPFDPYAKQIGHIVILWNNIHESLCDLFYFTSGLGRWTDTKYLNVAHIIWSEYRSDRSARDMLRLMIPVALSDQPNAIANVHWVLKQLTKLADDRDAVAHVPLSLIIESETSVRAQVDWSRFNRQSRKLANKDFDTWLKTLRITLKNLKTYLHILLEHIGNDSDAAPWPDRPPLPHLGQKAALSKPRGKKGKKSRQSQRGASPGKHRKT